MRLSLVALLIGCGSSEPSLTVSWSVVDAAGPVACPAGSTVDVVVAPTSATFPCTDELGVIEGLEDGQVRAELTLRGPDGAPLATDSRIAPIDGPSETTAVFVLGD